MPNPIVVRLFGHLDVRDGDGRPLDVLLRRPNRIALLGYLAVARPRGFHRRDKLIGIFWPDSPQGRARHALSQALSVLRAEMGEDALITRGDEEVAVNYDLVSVDVVEFERAVDARELEAALRVYRGDLLDGFFLSESPEFERWLESERTRLRRAALDAAVALAGRAEEAGATGRALEWARRAAALAPCDEAVVRRLMELLAGQGDRAGALEAFEDLARRLREEFELEPSAELDALAQAVRAGKPVGRRDRPPRGDAEAAERPPAEPPQPAPAVSQQPDFALRYRIERMVGQGGMAEVYVAQDLRYDRKVAIKVLRPELAAVLGPERFVREIETVACLSHPHILPLLDSGEVNGQLYYVMPYVEGGSLRDRLAREKQLPVEQAVQITRDVALALDYAHRKGVVHRDVKPENVLLVDGEALLTDFGIAYRLEPGDSTRLTAAGITVGTPEYMSPEQASGQAFDHRTDLYSLGCVLFEMLVGDAPFTGGDPQIVMARKRAGPAPEVRSLRDTVPPAVSQAAARSLARVPADRFGTAAEMAAAMARSLAQPAGERDASGPPGRRVTRINQPPSLAPSYFKDRQSEVRALLSFLRDGSKRLLTLVGRPGNGKTAVVCRTLQALEAGGAGGEGEGLRLDAVVYLTVYGAGQGLFPKLYGDLCKLLPPEAAEQAQHAYQNPQLAPGASMQALLEKFTELHAVVVLDNLEDLLERGTGGLADPELNAALRSVLETPHHTVKLILTTRTPPRDLLRIQPGRQTVLHLDEGLPSPYGEEILREMDADGRIGLRSASDDLLRLARERTAGNPRALEALFAVLAADRATTLDEVLSEHGGALPPDVLDAFIGEAYRRLDPHAQLVMRALAVFGRPVPETAVAHVLSRSGIEVNCREVLHQLVNLQLARRDARGYYLHPADQAYALSRLGGEERGAFAGVAAAPAAVLKARISRGTPPVRPSGVPPAAPRRAGFTARAFRRVSGLFQKIFRKTATPAAGQYRMTPPAAEPPYGAEATPLTMSTPPSSELPATREPVPPATALRKDAADFFRSARTPRSEWRSLDDLAAPLAEYDLRVAAGDFHGAADVLRDIAFDFLLPWGHYGFTLRLYQRIKDHLTDPALKENAASVLGTAYWRLGQYEQAIAFHQEGLELARALRDRDGEAASLGNLGTCLVQQGYIQAALEHHLQALEIHRQLGDREGEAFQVANAGTCLAATGQFELAVESYQRALAYARDVGDKRFEARQLGNLGVAFGCLGDAERASDSLEQAKRLATELGDRLVEAGALVNLGDVLTDQQDWPGAMSHFEAGTRIADEIQDPDLRARGRWGMALVALCTGDLARGRVLAEQAREFEVPMVAHEIVLLGLIQLRASQPREAEQPFRAALRHADDLLSREARLFAVLDAKGLALGGLALATGGQDHVASAAAAYRAARAIARAPGVVRRAALLFDQLAAADHADALSGVRPAVVGQESS